MYDIPAGVDAIIGTLENAGFEAYLVGGCVRDSVLGRRPHDWDICTSAKPEQMKNVFEGFRTIDTGLKHGTLTVMSNFKPYEVTTFRVDGEYSDHRRPDSVEFTTDLVRDLARRDFTINAMASGKYKNIIDPFGGMNDLKNKTIRCVGDPDARFNEDALRILRAMRFSATYGFGIEPETSESIHRNRDLLRWISGERIQSELRRMIMGQYALPVLLSFSDVISTIIPQFGKCINFDQNNRYHIYTVYEHIIRAMNNYSGDDEITRIALFLHDIGKPRCYTEDERGGHFHGHGAVSAEIADSVMYRLRFDNDTRESVRELVLYHDATIEPTKKTVRRWLAKIGPEQFARLLDVRMADILAHAPDTQASRIERCNALRAYYEELMTEEQCFSVKDLAINGHDVMSLGIPQGKMVGKVLQMCLDAVMDEEVPNDKESLMNFVRSTILKDG